MKFGRKIHELFNDRIFLLIASAGIFISFFFSMQQISFPRFLIVLFSGSTVSLLIAGSLRIENKFYRVGTILVIILALGALGLVYLQGQTSCLAWSPHSAEDPVTGQCKAYVYGGCGPTPEPWYYNSCSPESQEDLCNRLEDSSREDADQLETALCTNYPDLNLSKTEFSEENETLTVVVTESELNSSNTEKLQIKTQEKTEFRIEHGEKTYNTSLLVSENQSGIFNGSLEEGDDFTIIEDGTDRDKDGVKGLDHRDEDPEIYSFKWWNSEYNETRVALMIVEPDGSIETEQRY